MKTILLTFLAVLCASLLIACGNPVQPVVGGGLEPNNNQSGEVSNPQPGDLLDTPQPREQEIDLNDLRNFPTTGSPLSLDEAKKTPGYYIKDGDTFTLIYPMPLSISNVGTVSAIETIDLPMHNDTRVVNALVHPDYEILQVPQSAQIVFIGFEHFGSISKINSSGYVMQYELDFWESPSSSGVVMHAFGHLYDSVNGGAPRDVLQNIYHVERANVSSDMFGTSIQPYSRYLITGNLGDEYIFGRWQGTDWIEDTYTVDMRLFTGSGWFGALTTDTSVEVERTMDGYFYIKFAERPVGYHLISPSGHLEYKLPDAYQQMYESFGSIRLGQILILNFL
jgi:hypothetical protein